MTLREKLGQLIMFGFPGLTPGPEALRLIEEYKAGNIVLFAHNLESCLLYTSPACPLSLTKI